MFNRNNFNPNSMSPFNRGALTEQQRTPRNDRQEATPAASPVPDNSPAREAYTPPPLLRRCNALNRRALHDAYEASRAHSSPSPARAETSVPANRHQRLNSPPGASSTMEDASFKVRLLENEGKKTGRIAVFGTRINVFEGGKEVDISAPFSATAAKFEQATMNSFVRCADGEIRRFPGTLDEVDSLEGQMASGRIYDAYKGRIVAHVAKYAFNPEEGTGAFEVEGIRQKPVFKSGNTEVYKLGENRHMVPQPNFASCTYACENMLLMDQGYLRPDEPRAMPDLRREKEGVLDSIKKYAGVEPVMHEAHFDLKKTNSAAFRELQRKIETFGPCIISPGGHDRMLDEIREEKGKFLFTIRDPFHGTCTVVKGLEPLFFMDKIKVNKLQTLFMDKYARKTLNDSNHTLSAIFLPPKTR